MSDFIKERLAQLCNIIWYVIQLLLGVLNPLSEHIQVQPLLFHCDKPCIAVKAALFGKPLSTGVPLSSKFKQTNNIKAPTTSRIQSNHSSGSSLEIGLCKCSVVADLIQKLKFISPARTMKWRCQPVSGVA